jgi:recombination protein RecT
MKMTDNNKNTFLAIKEYGRSPEIIERFAEIVGKHNAGGYVQSAILAVANNEALQKCTPQSIFASALRAATVQLLCEPSLGQAYLVPFKDKATFIIGYKGLYQLALRTGKYRFINVGPIYEGELVFEDRMTGEITLNGGRTSNTVIGYLASFQLTSGFSKSLYMTLDEIHAHADKYSKSVNYASSPWKTNRVEMERKTVLRLLLSRYGYIDPKDALAISEDPEANEALPEDEEVTIIDGDSRTLNQVVEDLGFESDDEPEFEDEAEDKPEIMTIEKACTIKNSEGKPYFGLSVKSLNNIKANLLQYIEGNEIHPKQNAEIQEKLAAIKVLLKAKAEGSIQ